MWVSGFVTRGMHSCPLARCMLHLCLSGLVTGVVGAQVTRSSNRLSNRLSLCLQLCYLSLSLSLSLVAPLLAPSGSSTRGRCKRVEARGTRLPLVEGGGKSLPFTSGCINKQLVKSQE